MSEPESNESDWIHETTESTFEADVFERSRHVTVVVDFWATWCQPCRLLGPILEKLAREFAGQFILVKAETEKIPQAAAEFGVRGIPAVYGLKDGRVVDFFEGLLPEQQLREWLIRLLPSEVELLTSAAAALEESDAATAEQKYREAIQLDSQFATAKIQLARLLLAQERVDESRELIDELSQRGFLEPEAEKLKSALELRRQGEHLADVDQCRAAAASDPTDLNLQFKLAAALAAQRQYEEALAVSLELVRKDRKGMGEPARQLMVDVFRQLPDDSELVSDFRRKLSTALY